MAHNKDDNPTANHPWFGPIPTGADWNRVRGHASSSLTRFSAGTGV